MNRVKRYDPDKVFDVVNTIVMVILFLIVLYPLFFVAIASVSDSFSRSAFAIVRAICATSSVCVSLVL